MLRCLAFLAASILVSIVQAAEPAAVAQRWALLIGVDDYAYAQKLQYCGADQRSFRDQLVASGFPEDHCFLLDDKTSDARLRPTKSNIERHLDLVLNLADANDLIIIGFSGHGVHLGGKSFLCPGDCNLDEPKTLVPIDDVYDRLTKCAASFKLVVVDACRNDPRPGGARDMKSTDGTRALARSLQEIKPPEGVVLLNSCAPGEISWEDEKFGHGVFMHYLLDGLQGAADSGGDGSVSLNELQSYAGTKTKTYVANRYRVPQRPFFKGDLTTEALEYALLPIPGGVLPKFDRYDKTKPATVGIGIEETDLAPVVWGVLRGGPAEAAGIQADDLIVAIGSKKIVNGGEVFTAVDSYKPGDKIEFVVQRGNRQVAMQVVAEAKNDEVGLARMKEMAEGGNAWAMTRLAFAYLNNGFGLPRDDDECIRWCRRAADTGDALGLYQLARLYYYGTAVEKDEAEALRLLNLARAAKPSPSGKGTHGLADTLLGDMYAMGRGVPEDASRAAKCYQDAVDVGHVRAMWVLGLKYEVGKGVPQDHAKAMQLYRQAADAKLAEGENALAMMFNYGTGVPRDPLTARTWYERAVEHGHIGAHIDLGLLCQKGEGGPRDAVAAFNHYRIAAENDHVVGIFDLGVCYRDGIGVGVDQAKAMELFKRAAEKGSPDAEYSIAAMYYFGQGVPVDYKTAVTWYDSAAKKGIVGAIVDLGNMYRDAKGVNRDYGKAMEYYQAAAKKKDGNAECNIGALIYNGQGVQKDLTVARGWYESAADHGCDQAMYNLGAMYESGEGGPKNLLRAVEMYRKAADLGHADAKKALDELR